MRERVQGCVTVGVAMVGAGALALAPMAPQPAQQMRADQTRTVDVSDMTLLATVTPTPTPTSLLAALQILATGANTPADTSGGVAGSVQRLAVDTLQGLLGPIALAEAFGDDAATKAILANYIDAPLHIADPTIFAINDILPAPLGGGDYATDPRYRDDSQVLAFRAQVLYVLREQIKQALGLPSDLPATGATERTINAASVVSTDPTLPDPTNNKVGDPVFTASRLAQGLGFSAERLVQDTVLGALGPIAIAQALVKGDNQGVYDVVESYVDAPLHIADPTIFAIDDVLPKPLGGDISTDPKAMGNLPTSSLVSNIRANVLIPARDSIKPGLKNVLGVPKPDPELKVQNDSAKLASVTDGATPKKKIGPKHRATVNNPVSSALKKLAKDVKKATTPPKHEKASAE
jgi:hypothetical protein